MCATAQLTARCAQTTISSLAVSAPATVQSTRQVGAARALQTSSIPSLRDAMLALVTAPPVLLELARVLLARPPLLSPQIDALVLPVRLS